MPRLLPRRVVGDVVVSVGTGPASAGLLTSAPVAAGCAERRVRRFPATPRDGANEHLTLDPGTALNVNRFPLLFARNEITGDAVVEDLVPSVVVVSG